MAHLLARIIPERGQGCTGSGRGVAEPLVRLQALRYLGAEDQAVAVGAEGQGASEVAEPVHLKAEQLAVGRSVPLLDLALPAELRGRGDALAVRAERQRQD